jgi:hypothetical protein
MRDEASLAFGCDLVATIGQENPGVDGGVQTEIEPDRARSSSNSYAFRPAGRRSASTAQFAEPSKCVADRQLERLGV